MKQMLPPENGFMVLSQSGSFTTGGLPPRQNAKRFSEQAVSEARFGQEGGGLSARSIVASS